MKANYRTASSLAFLIACSLAAMVPAADSSPFPVDDRVTFQVGEASASPGETEVWVPLSFHVEPGGPSLVHWYAALQFDAAVMSFAGEARWTSPRGLVFLQPDAAAGGSQLLLYSQTFNAPDASTHVVDGEVVELRFCVAASAPPGNYPIELLEQTSCTHPGDPRLECGFTTLFQGPAAHPMDDTNRVPALLGGSLTVAGEAVAAGTCPVPLADGTILRTRTQDLVTFQLGNATAAPGQTNVALPISVLLDPGAPEVHFVSFALSFDPSVVAPADRGWFTLEPAKQSCGMRLHQPEWFQEEGRLSGQIFFGSDCGIGDVLSPANQGVVANLRFCVPATAQPGTYPVEFVLHAQERSPGTDAANTLYLGSTPASAYPGQAPVTITGSITVAGEPVTGGTCPTTIPGSLVTFKLGAVSAAPGAADVSVPLSISVEPDGPPVRAFTAVVQYDPAALGGVQLEYVGGPVFRNDIVSEGQEAFIEPGTVRLSIDNLSNPITSEEEVARLRFCVLESAAPGASPLSLVELAHSWGSHAQIRTTFTGDRGTQAPVLEQGSVAVGGAAQSGGVCQADVRPDPNAIATFSLGDAVAAPGTAFRVPFVIRAASEAEGFSFSVDFDEELLQAGPIEKLFLLGDGTTDYEFESLNVDNTNATPGNGGTDEGFLMGAVIYSLRSPTTLLPAGTDNEVLGFHFQVKPEAPAGTVTELQFLNFVQLGGGATIQNVLTVNGQSRYPGADASYLYLGAHIGIEGDVSIFSRGDSNGDEAVDLSDAQTTLDHLFLGGPTIRCADAADANDDGLVDIADPIHLLSFLFLGGSTIAPPYPAPGLDPTFDLLPSCPRGSSE